MNLFEHLTAALGWLFWGLLWLATFCSAVLVVAHLGVSAWWLLALLPVLVIDVVIVTGPSHPGETA